MVEALNAAGQTDLANMIGAMNDFTVGAGVDFEALRMVIVAVLAIYVVVVVPQLDPGLRHQHHHGPHHVAPA